MGSHVTEVLMKTWLRWSHGVRIWMCTNTPTAASPKRLAGFHPPLPSSPTNWFQEVPLSWGKQRSLSRHLLTSIMSARDSDDDVDFMDAEVDDKGRSSVEKSSWELPGASPLLSSIDAAGGSMAREHPSVREAVDIDTDAYSRLRCGFQAANPAVKPVVLETV